MEEFLRPMGFSQCELVKEIGVPGQRIGEIMVGRRSISDDTDLRPGCFFSLSSGKRLSAQVAYDTEVTKRILGGQLTRLKTWAEVDCKPSRALTRR